ncbi:restriction endonuclease subunit S [Roseibium aggregatum]|uniref:restriction endonuclease subunit S n=1 Tax=Roseibium aggregatum TaxID=187304 RepID=UPI003A981E80
MSFSSRWAVPQNWAWAPVGELADVTGGGTPSAKDPMNFVDDGGVPWLTPADLTGYNDAYISRGKRNLSDQGYAKSSAKLLPTGTVLFTSRAPIGYCAIASNPIATNQGFKSLTLFGGISAEYTRHYLKWSKPFLETLASGTTFLELSGSKLQKAPFPLPPLAEQKRIVAKLDTLSARSARARKDLARIDILVKRYKQAVLSKAFSGELTKDWRDRNNGGLTSEETAEIAARVDGVGQTRRGARTGTHQIDLKRLADIPSSWAKGIVGVAADILVGFAFKSSWYVESGVKLLRGANIAPGQIDWDDLKSLAPEVAADYSKYKLKRNDIVLAMDRPIISTGLKIAQVAERDEGCLLVQRVARLRPSVYASQSYLWWFMNSADFIAHSVSRSTGSDLPHISGDDISTCPLPLPPLQEQQEIVRRVESAFQKVDTLATEAKRALKLTDKLDEAILVKAFRGELVSQDPNDEPASILLDRIKAERAVAPKSRPSRIRRGKIMKTATDFLNSKLDSWPENGHSFQDLKSEFGGNYEDLKDAVFELLSDKKSGLEQVFDETTSTMTFKKQT